VRVGFAPALLVAVGAFAALAASAFPALAKPDALGSPAAPVRKASEVAPPANVTLAIEASTTRGPWKMRVTNEGDVPVTIVADARLLSLDVTPRSARKAEHCQLPDEMRPQDDLARPLVLPPKRSYSERFEPRLYCLDGRRLDALAPGAIVTATLGWSGHSSRPPLLVTPVEGLESRVLPSKSVTSLPIALPDEPTPSAVPSKDLGGAAMRGDAVLALKTAAAIDAASPSDITIPVTLVNEGHRTAIVRFRPETLAFDVIGPRGANHCPWSVLPAAPTRDLFTTLGPSADTTLMIVLSAYCTVRTLDAPGLYVVRASLDTRKASGADIGIRSFDGQVIATSPTVLRIRRGSRIAEPLTRPTLDRLP
jgi:hypothetical protein